MKKACLTVRERMMREATGKSASRRAGSSQGASSTSAAPRKPAGSSPSAGPGSSAAADVDKYTDLLLPFINSAGALSDPSVVPGFVRALPAFGSSMARTLPVTVLGLSSSAVLAAFRDAGGVDTLTAWMLAAMQEDGEHASTLLVEALGVLKALPVSKGFVQSTRAAKVVGALRKHDSGDVRRLAREVVAQWMAAVSSGSGGGSGCGTKQAAARCVAGWSCACARHAAAVHCASLHLLCPLCLDRKSVV